MSVNNSHCVLPQRTLCKPQAAMACSLMNSALTTWMLGRGKCLQSSIIRVLSRLWNEAQKHSAGWQRERELDLKLLYHRLPVRSYSARGPQPGCSTEPTAMWSLGVFGVRSRLVLVASISVFLTLAWKSSICEFLTFPPPQGREWEGKVTGEHWVRTSERLDEWSQPHNDSHGVMGESAVPLPRDLWSMYSSSLVMPWLKSVS